MPHYKVMKMEKMWREVTEVGEDRIGFIPGRSIMKAISLLRCFVEQHNEQKWICTWNFRIWKDVYGSVSPAVTSRTSEKTRVVRYRGGSCYFCWNKMLEKWNLFPIEIGLP